MTSVFHYFALIIETTVNCLVVSKKFGNTIVREKGTRFLSYGPLLNKKLNFLFDCKIS